MTPDELVGLYPWPQDALAQGAPLEWMWYFDLAAPLDDLWVHLCDTSRFNRALGLSEMHFEERAGVLHGSSVNGGVRHEWVEEPWEWETGRFLLCTRRYRRGFPRVGRGIYHFEPLDGERVRFYAYFGWIPRSVIGGLALRVGMPSIGRGYREVLARLAADLSHARQRVYQLPAPAPPQDTIARVSAIGDALRERGLARVSGADTADAQTGNAAPQAPDAPDPIDRLVELACTGDDLDVYRLQVRVLARTWDVPEDELLRLFLHATRLGLLDMSWDVVCPHCRGVREEAKHLGDVPVLGNCEVCGIDFTTDKENAIEITFHVHPSIREVPKRFFCSAEPSSKLHVKLQRSVAAGERVSSRLVLAPGRYRIRLMGEDRHRFLDVAGGDRAPGGEEVRWLASGEGDLVARVDGAGDRADGSPTVAPTVSSTVSIWLDNDTGARQTFVIETASWADVALRPAQLFNLQEFRDLFSEEYLAADLQLSVGEQTILFTDIVGSTVFYAMRGDPAAFVEVKKHFNEVFAIVARNRGAVIKTIGDAVMAAFSSPVDALIAGREIHECFHAERDDTPIRVRVSINTGACIAVNLNSGIDYFGSTVNLAAKLQACAEAGEIALSESTYDAPGVAAFFAELGADPAADGDSDAILARVTLASKTVGEPIPALRWRIYPPDAGPGSAAWGDGADRAEPDADSVDDADADAAAGAGARRADPR